MNDHADDQFTGLVCPECRSELVTNAEQLVCTAAECRLRFQIENGIPHLLADSAQQLADAEWQSAVQRSGSAAKQAE